MKLHLHLVRHGQTYFNRYNKLQGWSNSPLTEKGREDARKAGRLLSLTHIAAAYCSDTTRAQDTAQLILEMNHKKSVKTATSSRFFREQFYGSFEGTDMAAAWYMAGGPHGAPTYAEIVEKFGIGATKDFLKEADPFHDAESEGEFWARIREGYRLIANHARHSEEDPDAVIHPVHDGDDILIIAHGNLLLSLMQRFAPEGYDLSERPMNGSITTFDFDTDKIDDFDHALTLVEYNRTK